MTEHEQMVADCEARESQLTNWERSFIDDTERQLRNGRALSHAQAEKLNEIWDRVSDGRPDPC